MRTICLLVACASLALSGDRAAAAIVTENVTLQYDAPAPKATQFNPSTSVALGTKLGVATITSVEFSANFAFAKVGDFEAEHRSKVSIDHPSQLAAPGLAKISFQQSGLANSFSETSPGVQVGAGAEVFVDPLIGGNFSIPVNVIDVDLFIATAKSNSGALGSSLTDSDTASASRLAVGVAVPFVIDVGTVGAAPTITGTSTVDVGSSISAILTYQHRTLPGVMGSTPVALAGSGDLSVDLQEPGIYDFVLSDYELAGTLTSKAVPGITFDLTILNNVVASKFLGLSAAQQSTTTNFLYAASGGSQDLSFSIEVLAIPEPSSFALLAIGGIGLAWIARRTRQNGRM